MNKKTLRLGLIGKDVSKSTSGKIHTFILNQLGVDCVYEKHSINPEELDFTVRHLLGDCDGFNITIPYKRDIFEYLDGIQGDAFACGAVNTVVCATGQGYNTDGVGFLLMLETAGIAVQGKNVLVLGAGGAGRSTALALKNAGADVSMYRRNQAELQEACEQLGVRAATSVADRRYDIVINCTGVGMHDTVGVSPVQKEAFDGASVAIDLIYNPNPSEFLRLAKEQGLQTLSGEAMLFYQAYYADCLFLNREATAAEAKAFYTAYKEKNV